MWSEATSHPNNGLHLCFYTPFYTEITEYHCNKDPSLDRLCLSFYTEQNNGCITPNQSVV